MSGLRERLTRVRSGVPGPASSAPSTAEPEASGPGIAERLRRLGGARQTANGPATTEVGGVGTAGAPRAPNRPQAEVRDDALLARQLGAEQIAPGVLRLVREQGLAQPHGHWPLRADRDAVARLLTQAPGEPARWAAVDTETSGLAGGTGTWVFTFGLARWRGGRVEMLQFLLTRLDAEAAFLTSILEELAAVELVLSYNGKTFDLPLLEARLKLSRLCEPAGQARVHLDLLHPVRRAFASRWPDCRLASVEARLLGFRRAHDLPGAEAPAAWLDWLRRGDGSRLAGVLSHNRMDLLSVLALPTALAQVYRTPSAHGADAARVARWHLQRADPNAALLALRAATDGDVDARHLQARLHARAGDWAAALSIWERLAAGGDAAAHEALAKHFEHRLRDPRRALHHARALPPGQERDRRCLRLMDKIERIEPIAPAFSWTADG